MIPQSQIWLPAVFLGLLLLTIEGQIRVSMQGFAKSSKGKAVDLYTLSDSAKEVRIMTHGGIVVCLRVPWLP
jgi:hypothetical protein